VPVVKKELDQESMGRGKKYQPEQLVNLLRQIEVAVARNLRCSVMSPETVCQLLGWCQPESLRANRSAFHGFKCNTDIPVLSRDDLV
jgi:hypothetical protein